MCSKRHQYWQTSQRVLKQPLHLEAEKLSPFLSLRHNACSKGSTCPKINTSSHCRLLQESMPYQMERRLCKMKINISLSKLSSGDRATCSTSANNKFTPRLLFEANTTGIFSLAARGASSFPESPFVPTPGFSPASAFGNLLSLPEVRNRRGHLHRQTSLGCQHSYANGLDRYKCAEVSAAVASVRTNPDATVVVPRREYYHGHPPITPTPAIPIFNFDMFRTSATGSIRKTSSFSQFFIFRKNKEPENILLFCSNSIRNYS